MRRMALLASLLAWSCQGGDGRPLPPDPGRPEALEPVPEPAAEPAPEPVPEFPPERSEPAPEPVPEPPPDPAGPPEPPPPPDPGPEPFPEPPPEPVPDAVQDPGPTPPVLVLQSPDDDARAVVGNPVLFAGSTTCRNATVTFTADGRFPFGTIRGVTGPFQHAYAFQNPGIGRRVEVSVAGDDGCAATSTRSLTIQPAFAILSEERTDAAGNPFTVRIARFPTADPFISLVVTGSASPRTVSWFATSSGVPDVAAAINGGYFAAGSGPVSYAKGRTGYESPSGNVKGPRACLAWDEDRRAARVVLSMGRSWMDGTWGESLFPEDSDVVCGGPRLLEDGRNVSGTHLVSENFQSSGIGPDSPLPRTAACITEDGSVVIVAAQSDTVKTRGFTLAALADYLLGLGCRDALNLDGGGSTAFWQPGTYSPGTEDRPVYQAVLVTRTP